MHPLHTTLTLFVLAADMKLCDKTIPRVKMTAFWDMAPCSLVEVDWRFIVLMMEAVCTSETPVYFNETTLR
jgi:hypothetical protein